MLIEATEKPIRYRLRDGQELLLEPGKPVHLSDEAAQRLLKKAAGKVRISEESDIVMQPAAVMAKPIYFEQADGKIVGPAKLEFLAQVGCGERASFWAVITLDGQTRWVRSDLLRAKPGSDPK
jgi:hypothetical protein